MRCPHCNKEIPDQQIQQEAARIMIKKQAQAETFVRGGKSDGAEGIREAMGEAKEKVIEISRSLDKQRKG